MRRSEMKMSVSTKPGRKVKNLNIKKRLSNISSEIFSPTVIKVKENPVLRASHCWKIISEQIKDLLGSEVHTQWFSKVRPLVIANNILILRTSNQQACRWITTHYLDLVDMLLSFQDKKLSSFFISESDIEKSNPN